MHHRRFQTRQQASQEITEYIEIFYNRQRKQKRLGYLSPAQFTQQYYANLLVATPMDSIFESTYHSPTKAPLGALERLRGDAGLPGYDVVFRSRHRDTPQDRSRGSILSACKVHSPMGSHELAEVAETLSFEN